MIQVQNQVIVAYKMHTNGNDFLIIDETQKFIMSEEIIRSIANRKLGIGCDQVITYAPKTPTDVACKFYNQDGSSAELCLNGVYALASHIKTLNPRYSTIETQSIKIQILDTSQKNLQINIPNNALQSITKYSPQDLNSETSIIRADLVNVGNPHMLIQVKNLNDFSLGDFAAKPSIHQKFPDGINISAYLEPVHGITEMQTHERGPGMTLGCGSAGLAVLFLQKKITPSTQALTIQQPGGTILFTYTEQQIHMQAQCTTVGKVEINWPSLTH